MSDDRGLEKPFPTDPPLGRESRGTRPTYDGHEAKDRNDERDFVTFYRSFTPPLISFLIWHGASFELAADVAQETMRVAYHDWINIRHPRAWSRRVAARELARRMAEVNYEILTDCVPERPASLGDAADLSSESKVLSSSYASYHPGSGRSWHGRSMDTYRMRSRRSSA